MEDSLSSATTMGAQREPVGTEQTIGLLVSLAEDNPDKAHVMTCIGQFVAAGFAAWQKVDNGDIEVRFASGQVYLLAETTILRLA